MDQEMVYDLSKATLYDPDADKGRAEDKDERECLDLSTFVTVPPERYGKRITVMICNSTSCKVRRIKLTSEALHETLGDVIRAYELTAQSGQEVVAFTCKKRDMLMGKGATSLTRATIAGAEFSVKGAGHRLEVLV